MRAGKRAGLLSAMISACLLSSPAAHGATFDVVGWAPTDDPFDANAKSTSISGFAILDARNAVRANLRANCDGGRVEFVVGIANGAIEPLTGNEARIEIKLDQFSPNQPLVTLTGNANRFSFTAYKSSFFASGSQFLIGLPMNGTTAVLRISLKQQNVVGFLAQCRAVQEADEKKVAEDQKKAARPPAAKPPVRADSEEEQKYLAAVSDLISRQKHDPPRVQAQHIRGIATVAIFLDDKGLIVRAAIYHSSGYPDLDAEALAAVKRAAPLPPPPNGTKPRILAAIEFKE